MFSSSKQPTKSRYPRHVYTQIHDEFLNIAEYSNQNVYINLTDNFILFSIFHLVRQSQSFLFNTMFKTTYMFSQKTKFTIFIEHNIM